MENYTMPTSELEITVQWLNGNDRWTDCAHRIAQTPEELVAVLKEFIYPYDDTDFDIYINGSLRCAKVSTVCCESDDSPTDWLMFEIGYIPDDSGYAPKQKLFRRFDDSNYINNAIDYIVSDWF